MRHADPIPCSPPTYLLQPPSTNLHCQNRPLFKPPPLVSFHLLTPTTINPETPHNRYYPGFARKEHDAEKDESWSIWETDAEDYNARFLGPHTGWFAVVGGNLHQAMWMATREQVCIVVC